MDKKRLTSWIITIIFTVSLILLIMKIPLTNFMDLLAETRWSYFLLGILLVYVNSAITTLFQWIVIRSGNVNVSYFRLFRMNQGIKLYSVIGSSLIGSGLRVYRLARKSEVENVLSSLTFSRFVDVCVTLIDGSFWLLLSLKTSNLQWFYIVALMLALIGGWSLFIKSSHSIIKFIDRIQIKINRPNIVHHSLGLIRKYVASLDLFKTFPVKRLLLLVFISIVYDLVGLLSIYCLSLSLSVPVSFVDLGWMRSVMSIASLIPIKALGMIGLGEVSFYFLLTANGVSPDQALALSSGKYVTRLIGGLVGGIFEFAETLEDKKAQRAP